QKGRPSFEREGVRLSQWRASVASGASSGAGRSSSEDGAGKSDRLLPPNCQSSPTSSKVHANTTTLKTGRVRNSRWPCRFPCIGGFRPLLSKTSDSGNEHYQKV